MTRTTKIVFTIMLIGQVAPRVLVAQATSELRSWVVRMPARIHGYTLDTIGKSASMGLAWRQYTNPRAAPVSVGVSDSSVAQTEVDKLSRQAIATFKTDLRERLRTRKIDDVRFPLQGAIRDTVGGRILRGYRLVAVTRRADQIFVMLAYAYGVGDRVVAIWSRVPASGWESTDVPLLASDVIGRLAAQMPP